MVTEKLIFLHLLLLDGCLLRNTHIELCATEEELA